MRCLLLYPRCKAVRERIIKSRLLGRGSHVCGGASSTSTDLLAHQAQVSLKFWIRFCALTCALFDSASFLSHSKFVCTYSRGSPISFFLLSPQAKEQARRSWMVSRAFKAKVQSCGLRCGLFVVWGLTAFFGTVCCLSCLLQGGAVRHWYVERCCSWSRAWRQLSVDALAAFHRHPLGSETIRATPHIATISSLF